MQIVGAVLNSFGMKKKFMGQFEQFLPWCNWTGIITERFAQKTALLVLARNLSIFELLELDGCIATGAFGPPCELNSLTTCWVDGCNATGAFGPLLKLNSLNTSCVDWCNATGAFGPLLKLYSLCNCWVKGKWGLRHPYSPLSWGNFLIKKLLFRKIITPLNLAQF